ncbi:hypothetical protein LOTGIDRAFT_109284 [Lottia gigantea]|uniref:IF rod domain-containing protein n=1 Tax=Lottia gigantea TaxID=225164 RepID=V4CQU1_LOTGI|nr:hypothetical protein LOTGIDRAFT_109284 [Lottia gigantea]ESP04830.1 hypothetical protein LOTGIDRAFT_109284 [Lottia gigantea]
MSTKGQQKQEFASSGRGGSGFIHGRTTLITRSGKNPTPSGYSMRSSFGGGLLNMAPGTYQNMSHEGVVNVKGKREHEKKEMQSLNERLASYIDKVRFLEARNAQLEQELDVYRNQKQADFKPIRDQYETELNQARRVIDELAGEKANYDAKMAGLQDLVDSLKDTNETLENHNNELRQKIDNQSTQIGSYEGELGTLRLRIESLEDENKHLRELLKKRSDENMALRTDLDNETAAHIEADCRATTLEEEVDFLKALLDKMPQESQKPVLIKGQNLEDFWKNSMSKAIRDIQNEYENKLDIMRQDMEMRMQSQVRQLQSGAVRDNMETTHAREESKKLKSQLGDTASRITNLEGMVAALESERNDLRRKLALSEDELATEKAAHQDDRARLTAEMESVLAELQQIMDAKLSLELEIACYRQLLEGEENRLGMKSIVEQAIGTRTKGAGNLSDIVQQTS